MKAVEKVFFFVVKAVEKIVGYLLITGLAVIIALMTMQIINRYFVKSPFAWTEELCRYLFVWITILGSGLALRNFELVGFELFIDKVSPRVRKIMQVAGLIGISTFAYIFTVYGTKLMQIAIKGKTITPALGVPMSWIYIIFPLGGGLILVMTLACIIDVLKGRKETIHIDDGSHILYSDEKEQLA